MRALAAKWLWWRHAWPFEWAHKPLCEPYREDVLRIGRLHLCRGCSALKAGFFVVSPLMLWLVPTAWLPELFAALFAIVSLFSHPALHSRWTRPVRDLLRCAAGCLVPLAVALGIAGQVALGLGALVALGVIYFVYAHLRKSRRLQRCETCEESSAGVCSGYALQASLIRDWEEQAAQREMARRGFVG